MKPRKKMCVGAILLFAVLFAQSAITAEAAWKPEKPISLIIPSTPGGGHDNNARLVAKYAEKYAGQPINVLNQSAGGGVVGMTNVMTAAPDGLTVGQFSISLVSDQYLVSGAKYTQDSFQYIGQIAEDPNCLVVKADGPYGKMSLEEFLAFARENPGRIRIGVSGHWTNHDYTRFQLEKVAEVKFQRVSIKGGANIVLGILAGDLDAGVPYPSEIKGALDGGELKVLATNGNARSKLLPEVPTFSELGYDVNLPIWRIWGLPKETPREIVDGWAVILEKTMNDPELIEEHFKVGIGMEFKNSEDTRKLVEKAHTTYHEIIKEADLIKK